MNKNNNISTNSLRPLALAAALTASLLATGCVTGSDGIAGADDSISDLERLDDSKEVTGPAAGPIVEPVFYESNEDGEVIGGPLADEAFDTAAHKNAGSRPIHVQKYGPFGNGGTLGTGFPTSDWIAVVVGMDTTDGDINEVGTGNPLRAFPFQSNGIWHVTFDLRSHRDNESWSIWVMYIQRSMASATNF